MGGATIFLAYIAAALYYTFSTLRQLYVRHLTSISSKEHHGNLKRFTVIFATLSLASFAALSVNMIAFLVVSFQRFDLESHGSGRTAALPMRVLGWLKTSTNFTDFSMQLVHSTTAFWWTSRALRSTLLAFMYMGNLGMYPRYRRLYLKADLKHQPGRIDCRRASSSTSWSCPRSCRYPLP